LISPMGACVWTDKDMVTGDRHICYQSDEQGVLGVLCSISGSDIQ
jgi:hypothetical protein